MWFRNTASTEASRSAVAPTASNSPAIELSTAGCCSCRNHSAQTAIHASGNAERIAASQLVDKKLRAMGSGGPVDRDTATRRLVGMLARKGYNSSVAYSVVRERLDSAELRDEQR